MNFFTTKQVFVSLIGILAACDQPANPESSSLEPEQEEVICTMQFVTLHVTVKGGPLSEYYTLREGSDDTLTFTQEVYPDAAMYPVLDDSFKEALKNTEENFRFIGMIDDSVVVNEPYIISADACHIMKVSGRDEVNIQPGN